MTHILQAPSDYAHRLSLLGGTLKTIPPFLKGPIGTALRPLHLEGLNTASQMIALCTQRGYLALDLFKVLRDISPNDPNPVIAALAPTGETLQALLDFAEANVFRDDTDLAPFHHAFEGYRGGQ